MPFIDRDSENRVVGIFNVQQREDQEYTDEAVELYIPPAAEVTPVEKLRAFLAQNPDVLDILKA
jgi:hypothetical protein